MYNSKTEMFHGIASSVDNSSLADLISDFHDIAKNKENISTLSADTDSDAYVEACVLRLAESKTCTILQVMLRELTSEFDALLSYYEVGKDLTAIDVMGLVENILDAVFRVGFHPRILVADGASVNFTAFRYLCGPQFNVKKSTDIDQCKPFFIYEGSGLPVFVSVDPTHVWKSCRNALFNSKPGGSRIIRMYGRQISWSHIEHCWAREQPRILHGKPETSLSLAAIDLNNYSKMRSVTFSIIS